MRVLKCLDEQKLCNLKVFHNVYIDPQILGWQNVKKTPQLLLAPSTLQRLVHGNFVTPDIVCALVKNLAKSPSKNDHKFFKTCELHQLLVDEGWASKPNSWTFYTYPTVSPTLSQIWMT